MESWWERGGFNEAEAEFIRLWMRKKVRSWLGAHGGKLTTTAERLNRKKFSSSKRRQLIKSLSPPRPRNLPKIVLLAKRRESILLDSLYSDRGKSWKSVMRRKPHFSIVCKNFSFIDFPNETIRTLRDIAMAESLYANVRLHFEDEFCLDVGAYLIFEEMWRHMIPVFSGGRIKPPIASVLSEIGLRDELGWNVTGSTGSNQDIIPFPFQRQERPDDVTHSTGIEPPKAALVTTRLIKFIDNTLGEVANAELIPEARRGLTKLVGEILDNAQTHGTNDKRGAFTITGFLARREENEKKFSRFHLGFLSLGATISTSLETAPEEVSIPMELYVNMHVGKNNLSKENLRTVYAIRDGVTRLAEKINVVGNRSLGGTGLADILDFFAGFSQFAEPDDHPKLVIVSGSTYISVEQPYLQALPVGNSDENSGGGHRRELWFNTENSIDIAPDTNHVFTLPGHIPGTLVTLAFNIDPNLLKELENEDHRPE